MLYPKTNNSNIALNKQYISQLNIFILSFILVITILIFHRQIYWRPYNETIQYSLASYHAHGFAIANFAGLGKNPFVAREINIGEAKIQIYNHWPNLFFLTLSLAIKIFGNIEVVGRTVAILYNLIGLYLLAFSFRGKRGFSFIGVPLLLLAPLGKAAIPFVFIDASFILWIGILSAIASLNITKIKLSTYLFRSGIFISHFFIQLIFPFTIFLAYSRFIQHKNIKKFIIDLIIVFISFSLIIIFLSWNEKGIYKGFHELLLQFLHRSSIVLRYPENVTFVQLLLNFIRHLVYNFGLLTLFLPFSYYYIYRKKNCALYLLPAVIVYSVIMRNYVGVHTFANLPFIAISYMSLLLGLEILMNDIFNKKEKNKIIKTIFLFLFVSLLSMNIILAIKPIFFASVFNEKYYLIDKQMANERQLFLNIKNKIEYSHYNAFIIQDGTYRIDQFFLGEKVINGIINKNKKKSAYINLKKGLIIPKN